MANPPVNPDNIQPFAPPPAAEIEDAVRPELPEARDLAEKILRGKAPEPVGYTVAHDRVGSHGNHGEEAGEGAWTRGRRLSAKAVRDHFRGAPEADALIQRLVSIGALVPFYE
jgi:hypothetical protein